ncbi:30S ribosomal protein S20 [candidate division KSB1 bacterium]
MAQHKSTKKRIVLSKKQNARNRVYKSRLKSVVKNALDSDSAETSQDNLKEAVSILDKLVSKKILHKNTASRKKSQLAKQLNRLN